MKSYGVTIQINPRHSYFHVPLAIRLAAFCKMRLAILPSFDFNRSPGFHVTDRWPAGSIFNR